MTPLRSLLHSLHFPVFRSLLRLPLDLSRDEVLKQLFSPKRRRDSKSDNLLAHPSSQSLIPSSSQVDLQQPPALAKPIMTVETLNYLLRHMVERIHQAIEIEKNPLHQTKYRPICVIDDLAVNTAEPMTPAELIEAMTPIMPALATVGRGRAVAIKNSLLLSVRLLI